MHLIGKYSSNDKTYCKLIYFVWGEQYLCFPGTFCEMLFLDWCVFREEESEDKMGNASSVVLYGV